MLPTRITSYNVCYTKLLRQIAEMLKKADPQFVPTVEESQGSVQNVKESFVRPGNFVS